MARKARSFALRPNARESKALDKGQDVKQTQCERARMRANRRFGRASRDKWQMTTLYKQSQLPTSRRLGAYAVAKDRNRPGAEPVRQTQFAGASIDPKCFMEKRLRKEQWMAWP